MAIVAEQGSEYLTIVKMTLMMMMLMMMMMTMMVMMMLVMMKSKSSQLCDINCDDNDDWDKDGLNDDDALTKELIHFHWCWTL